jgi:hypothetical protein
MYKPIVHIFYRLRPRLTPLSVTLARIGSRNGLGLAYWAKCVMGQNPQDYPLSWPLTVSAIGIQHSRISTCTMVIIKKKVLHGSLCSKYSYTYSQHLCCLSLSYPSRILILLHRIDHAILYNIYMQISVPAADMP